MSDMGVFGNAKVVHHRFVGVEHGTTHVTMTSFSGSMTSSHLNNVEHLLTPDEAESLASDLLRRVNEIKTARAADGDGKENEER